MTSRSLSLDSLSLNTLGRVPAGVRPAYDPRALGVGIVHLGAGAFFRAHPAVYTEQVVAGGDHRWGIHATSQRSPDVADTLRAQDGLYAVLERPTAGRPSAVVVGAVRDATCAADDPDSVVSRIANPDVHVVTLTVTEKGYRIGASGGLDADAEVAADLAGRLPRTVVGQLVRGVQRRAASGAGPLSVVCCDNLSANGPLLRRLVLEFADRLPSREAADVTAWVQRHVAFPATMVDRIVPATTDRDRVDAARLIGCTDEATVVAEPFRQWVIADEFAGPRPEWEKAGAVLTTDVEAYERVKLRILNATHSLVAYLGALAGYRTIADAMRDDLVEAAARALVDHDQMPTLTAPDGMDLAAYREEVLARFRNPALGHRTEQVAMDGSQKLPQRLLPALRERRAAGALPQTGALLIAAWMRFLSGRGDDGQVLEVRDPLDGRLVPLLHRPAPPREITRDVLRVEEVFGTDLADDGPLVEAVASWYAALQQRGVRDALRHRL